MAPRQYKYSAEELARRGHEVYQKQVRPLMEEGNHGKVIAVDIDTGAFEVDDNIMTAGDRLFARLPDAQLWYVRIGYPAVYHIRHFTMFRRSNRLRCWAQASWPGTN